MRGSRLGRSRSGAAWGLAALILLGACAGSRIYLLDLNYSPAGVSLYPGVAGKTVTVALYNFQDSRTNRQNVGQRAYPDGNMDIYQLDSGSVEQLMTRNAAKILEKAGFQVNRVNRYLDPTREDFKSIPGEAAMGGRIEAFWVEVRKSGYTTWDTDARLRMQINWGLPQGGIWLSRTIEGAASEKDRPLYNFKHAQAKLTEVFKDGMDQLLKNEKALQQIAPK